MESGTIINSNPLDNSANDLKGLTMLTAAIFITGEMSGTGVLSLPKAIAQSGWSGAAMILICCVISGYCGIRLSSCWLIILNKNNSLRHGVRDPFPLIAYEAAGNVGRYLVYVVSYIQLFGAAVIFLLIASQNMASLLSKFFFHFCDWSILITVIMAPFAMLGTPKDFWPIAVGAMSFTAIACLFIFIESMIEMKSPLPKPFPITFGSYSQAFGTFAFSFGGAVIFPTIQTDMIKPTQFPKAVIISYITMLVFYLPVSIGGFIVFSGNIKDNIIDNLNNNWIKTTILILITGHLLTAFNIILNPIYQAVEKFLNAPQSFSFKRVIIRSSVLIAVLFVAQSIPNFGPILSFIGGSSVSLSSFTLPCIFYILLCKKPQYQKHISKFELVILSICIIISIICGISSTYFSVDALFNQKTFVPPCYVNRTQ